MQMEILSLSSVSLGKNIIWLSARCRVAVGGRVSSWCQNSVTQEWNERNGNITFTWIHLECSSGCQTGQSSQVRPAVDPTTTHGNLEHERARCIMGNRSISRNQPELVHFHLSSSRPAWERQKHGLLSEAGRGWFLQVKKGCPWIFYVGGVKGQVLMEHSNPDGQV